MKYLPISKIKMAGDQPVWRHWSVSLGQCPHTWEEASTPSMERRHSGRCVRGLPPLARSALENAESSITADCLLHADSAVRLGEELKDASYSLPRAMCTAAIVNYILGLITTLTLMSNLSDVTAALTDRSGQPWVAVVFQVTGCKAATIAMICVMILLHGFCSVIQITTSSRQIFAFARDRVRSSATICGSSRLMNTRDYRFILSSPKYIQAPASPEMQYSSHSPLRP